MVGEEENGVSNAGGKGSTREGSGGDGDREPSLVSGSVDQGMTRAAASPAPEDVPGPSSTPSPAPVSAPAARRLARTQAVIEHLQQNLSTRLKDSTVQSLRSSYVGGRSQPAARAPDALPGDTATDGESKSPEPHASDKVPLNGIQSVAADKRPVGNGSIPVHCTDDIVIQNKTGASTDKSTSKPKGALNESSEKSSQEDSSPESREKEQKTRVSWTTKLLEHLSLEESQKKEKAEQLRAARPHRRLVRYPGQKDFVPTHIPAIAKRVSPLPQSPPQPGADRRSRGEKLVTRSHSEDRSARVAPPPPPPRRATLTDGATEIDGGKDAYAVLISKLKSSEEPDCVRPKSLNADLFISGSAVKPDQLEKQLRPKSLASNYFSSKELSANQESDYVTPISLSTYRLVSDGAKEGEILRDKQQRTKSSASNIFSPGSVEKLYEELERVPRPKSVASDLLSPNSVFESNSPRAVPTPTSPPAVYKTAGASSRKTVHGDYFLFSKEFVEANVDPLQERPIVLKSAPSEASSKFSSNFESRAMNSSDGRRSISYIKGRDLSPRPLDLSKKPLSLVNNLSFDEDTMISRGSQRQGNQRVDIPGYSANTGRLKAHSTPQQTRGGSPASTKSSPDDIRSPAAKSSPRSPVSDSGSSGRPRSTSPRSTRKSSGGGRSTPSGLRRLLSPGSLFSSHRQRSSQSSPGGSPGDEAAAAERRALLGTTKVYPAQGKPHIETAFLSNASPTKQNQANQSRRSKSVSPSRDHHLQPRQQQARQQQSVHQPQNVRPHQHHAPPPSQSSPVLPTTPQQLQSYQQHIPVLQPAPIRLSPRQASPLQGSPQHGSPSQSSSRASPLLLASPLQSSPARVSPRPATVVGSLQDSPGSQGSPGRVQGSPGSQTSQTSSQTSPPRMGIEERFQQLRRELSHPSPLAPGSRGSRASTLDALLSPPLPLTLPPPAPRRGGDGSRPGGGDRDSPDSVAAAFVRSRRDVRYASLPTRYTQRPASAPLHLQQPIYENVQTRYVAPIALDLERNAISGSPDIRQQLQHQKRQLLLQQRRQQEQLYLLQQQTHLGGRNSPLTSPSASESSYGVPSRTPEPLYGLPSRASASTPTTPQQQRVQLEQQQQRAQFEQIRRLQQQQIQQQQMQQQQMQQQMAQQLPPRCSSAEPVQLRHKPIFKRGSLVAESSQPPASPDNAVPKRVSFTGGEQRGASATAWPTRNGPAPTPPTRQHAEASTRHEQEAPNRPLPPVPLQHLQHLYYHSESESGSEAGEVQRILMRHQPEEEWGADGKARGPPGSEHAAPPGGREDELRRSGGGGSRSGRRDEPRRHTLSGDHHHQHQAGSLARSMDLESPLPRGYPPPSTAMLFDDDPGIMSEVETSSTGFRRGGKQRSSLPVVRTPSKTLERPLGLVFLQYRSETKRALLPNEITSIDTVKALFVRSFPKQLTMEYLDSPHVKIYIHDSSKDMFYELEDVRSHLRDIRDRSVLRLFESADINGGVLPGAGVGVMAPSMWDQDQSYFSEPEFDSEYHHQHIHKSKTSSKGGSGNMGQQPYYMTHSYPPGGTTQGSAPATLPRGGPLLRAYSPAVVPPVPAERMKTLPQGDRIHSESGYMSSPERGGPRAYPAPYTSGAPGYEDPYYSQYASRSGSITPVIDEEASDTELMDEQYSLYGVKLRPVAPQPPRGQFPAPQTVGPYDTTRLRVENMERQLANLTGLVQKALTQTPTPREYLQVPAASRDANYRNAVDEYDKHSSSSSASLPDKSVSFEKSVSFSDEPPDMNSPKQHSPQHTADSKPTKPAIKSSTLPRMSSQERTERDRHKPAPPPKPVSLSPGQYEGRNVYRDLHLTPEMYNQLRGLQKKAKDLRQEVRNLRRMSQAQAHTVRETIRDTFIKIRTMLLLGGEEAWSTGGDAEKLRLSREEDAYKQEMLRLEKDLTELESTVEELRGNVINRKTRVNMSDVENMALILSKSSKTVADLKVRFPSLQEGMKSLLSSEMEKVVREEKFLKEEPERLESALRRCKKLTGTLVTLKRLASVQEQRLPPSTQEASLSPTLGTDSDPPITPPAHGKAEKLTKHFTRGSKVK